jgi:hypothetical protein
MDIPKQFFDLHQVQFFCQHPINLFGTNSFVIARRTLLSHGPFTNELISGKRSSYKAHSTILEDNLVDLFISTLKDCIQHEVRLLELKSLHCGNES